MRDNNAVNSVIEKLVKNEDAYSNIRRSLYKINGTALNSLLDVLNAKNLPTLATTPVQ